MKTYAYVQAENCIARKAVKPGTEIDGKPVSSHNDWHKWMAGKRTTLGLLEQGLSNVGTWRWQCARLVAELYGWSEVPE